VKPHRSQRDASLHFRTAGELQACQAKGIEVQLDSGQPGLDRAHDVDLVRAQKEQLNFWPRSRNADKHRTASSVGPFFKERNFSSSRRFTSECLCPSTYSTTRRDGGRSGILGGY
jgi:hypothetical protein